MIRRLLPLPLFLVLFLTSPALAVFTDLASVPLHQFQAIPNTAPTHASQSAVFPSAEPPSSAASATSSFITTSWTGAAWDEKNRELLVTGGGHNSSAWNIVFGFKIPRVGETPTGEHYKWRRVVDMNETMCPSGCDVTATNFWVAAGANYDPPQWTAWTANIFPADGGPGTLDSNTCWTAVDGSNQVRRVNGFTGPDGIVYPGNVVLSRTGCTAEIHRRSAGQYGDGTPNSIHSYGLLTMLRFPFRGLWRGPGAGYDTGGNGGSTFIADLTAGLTPQQAWRRQSPSVPIGVGNPGGFHQSTYALWDPYNSQVIAWRSAYVRFWKTTSVGVATTGYANLNPGGGAGCGGSEPDFLGAHIVLDTRRRHVYCLAYLSGGVGYQRLARFKLGEKNGTRYAMGTQATIDIPLQINGTAVGPANKFNKAPAGGVGYDHVNDRLIFWDPTADGTTDTKRMYGCPLVGDSPTSVNCTLIPEFQNGEAPLVTDQSSLSNGLWGRFQLIGDGLGIMFQAYNQPVHVFRVSTPAPQTFEQRRSSPDVTRWYDFDDYPDMLNHLGGADETWQIQDTVTRVEGTGALKFIIKSNATQFDQQFFRLNFSPNTNPTTVNAGSGIQYPVKFGEDAEFFVQGRVRFSAAMLNPKGHISGFSGFDSLANGGWKMMMIGQGDHPIAPGHPNASGDSNERANPATCVQIHYVTVQGPGIGGPQFYNGCPNETLGTEHAYGWDYGNVHSGSRHYPYPGGSDWEYQPGRASPLCLRSWHLTHGPGEVGSNCFLLRPDEWMTVQWGLQIGKWFRGPFRRAVTMWYALNQNVVISGGVATFPAGLLPSDAEAGDEIITVSFSPFYLKALQSPNVWTVETARGSNVNPSDSTRQLWRLQPHRRKSATVTVSGTTATFAQAETYAAVGDQVEYGGGFIGWLTAKTSDTVWTIRRDQQGGGTSASCTNCTLNAIRRYTGTGRARMWMARPGQPQELVFDAPEYDISNQYEHALYGKLFIVPYINEKLATETHPEAYIWWDNLIISSQFIPDPIATEDGGEPPAPPPPVTPGAFSNTFTRPRRRSGARRLARHNRRLALRLDQCARAA